MKISGYVATVRWSGDVMKCPECKHMFPTYDIDDCKWICLNQECLHEWRE